MEELEELRRIPTDTSSVGCRISSIPRSPRRRQPPPPPTIGHIKYTQLRQGTHLGGLIPVLMVGSLMALIANVIVNSE